MLFSFHVTQAESSSAVKQGMEASVWLWDSKAAAGWPHCLHCFMFITVCTGVVATSKDDNYNTILKIRAHLQLERSSYRASR